LVGFKRFATDPNPLFGNNGRFADKHSYQPGCDKQHWRQHDERNASDKDVEGSFAKSAKCGIAIGISMRMRAGGIRLPKTVMH
jgi:hypothetical protein